jgi:hypothetical protein
MNTAKIYSFDEKLPESGKNILVYDKYRREFNAYTINVEWGYYSDYQGIFVDEYEVPEDVRITPTEYDNPLISYNQRLDIGHDEFSLAPEIWLDDDIITDFANVDDLVWTYVEDFEE